LVFITAYDQYAVAAFEAQAVDYLVKPVHKDRLKKCTQKLALSLENNRFIATNKNTPAPTDYPPPAAPSVTQLAQIAALLTTLGAAPAPASVPSHERLQVIQASQTTAQGMVLVMVPVAQVIYFEAADKYVRVLTAEREVLIRTPLKDLLPQLDPMVFWQIHRGTVVRVDAMAQATRDEAGKLWLHLRHRPERLPVSRLYAHLFKAM
jgi:DNA-binding LytR/AlgR family response regulator